MRFFTVFDLLVLNFISLLLYRAINSNKGIVNISLSRTGVDQVERTNKVKLPPGNYFLLTVSDNGDGIDSASLERIFDPYFTTKEENGGTGLGLAVIKQIVQDDGGHIFVHSEVGKGSVFDIYLPLIEEGGK